MGALPDFHKELPVRVFVTEDEWIEWLAVHHATEPKGFWMAFAKKGTGASSITYEQARDGGLRYGWIDSIINRIDETWYACKFTPRRPKSVWSKVNVGVVEDLYARGLMHESGMLQVEAAKKDGRWERAYAGSATIEVPADFSAALEQSPKALEFFQGATKTIRYSYLFRLHQIVDEQKRIATIEKFVKMLEQGKTF